MRRTVGARRALAALALAAALPAAAYILPVAAILRHMGERRSALNVSALDVSGTLLVEGDAAQKLAAGSGLETTAGQLAVPARFLMKVPERCRLEIAPPESAEAERPYVAVRDGRIVGQGGMRDVPATVALVRALCTVLASQTAGDAERVYATALSRRGIALEQVSLGRFDGRIAYVIGGREKDARPLLFVEKDGFQPLRFLAAEGGTLEDVRLLGWGSPTGGDWFPRAVEVWERDTLRLRFTTEKTASNPKLPDALFP